MKEKEINEPNSTDMNRKGIVTAFLLAAGLLAGREAQAQRTYEEMEQLTVNERVTMVVTVSEPVRPADISTDKESLPRERKAYNNSAVSMSTAEMTRYARRIGNSPAQRGRREESDFSQRQDTDYRDDGTTELQPQHQPEHRLRRRAVGRFVQR
jgi:predicted amino acid-binding ACT domain protein